MRVSSGVYLVLLIIINLLAFVLFLRGFFPVKHNFAGFAEKSLHNEPYINKSIHDQVTTGEITRMCQDHIRQLLKACVEDVQNVSKYRQDMQDTDKCGQKCTDEQHILFQACFDSWVYDRMVFILIDALRADFVLPSGDRTLPRMEFVLDLIMRNKTLSYLAKAHPPTVTMPRIKALTTGGIPGFIDVVMNFDSQSVIEDNVISQLYRHGRHLVFYGDDTWMRLFPNHFIRTDGTTSFFVSDFTEVDNNVTRHIDAELMRDDWDVLILHYLGLDHIGHLAGPFSPLVKPKLQEMDTIVKQIYKGLSVTGRDLIVLCGDHGMSDQGSHGGSSPAETATPLVFINPAWSDGDGLAYDGTTVEQIDLASTLSLALGVPIPQNNLGTVIFDVLRDLSPRDMLKAAYNNAQQLLRVLQQNIADSEQDSSYLKLERAEQLHRAWLLQAESEQEVDSPAGREADHVVRLYVQAMTSIRNKLSGMLLHYDLHAMAAAVAVIWMVLICLCLQLAQRDQTVHQGFPDWFFLGVIFSSITFIHTSICTSTQASDVLCSHQGSLLTIGLGTLLFSWVVSAFCSWVKNIQRISWRKVDTLQMVLLCGTGCHSLSLLSSSFVEEEHQTWYFLSVTCCLALIRRRYMYKGAPSVSSCSDTSASYQQISYKTRTVPKETQTDDRNGMVGSQMESSCNLTFDWTIVTGVIMISLCRLCRSWNQTGDKWSHLPDISDWLTLPENKLVLSLLVLLSCMSATIYVYMTSQSKMTSTMFLCGSLFAYCFRSAGGSLYSFSIHKQMSQGVMEARLVYGVILLMMLKPFLTHFTSQKSITNETSSQPSGNYTAGFNQPDVSDIQISHSRNNSDSHQPEQRIRSKQSTIQATHKYNEYSNIWPDMQCCWLLLMILLLRPHNIVLSALVAWQEYILRQHILSGMSLSVNTLTLIYYWMGQASYFYQGNSNSLSSVDVSAGYIGLEDFSPVIIGVLMALSTYAMPCFWLISLIRVLYDGMYLQKRYDKIHSDGPALKRWNGCLHDVLVTLSLCRVFPLAIYTVLVSCQRYHLFVWTVFSPKLLYEGMLTLIVTVFVCLLTLVYMFVAK